MRILNDILFSLKNSRVKRQSVELLWKTALLNEKALGDLCKQYAEKFVRCQISQQTVNMIWTINLTC